MKKMYLAWILIVGGLILSLVEINNIELITHPMCKNNIDTIKNTNRKYKALESDMKEQANAYIIRNKVDLSNGESIKFDDNILEKAGFLKTMQVENDKCTGYVDVKRKTSGYDFKAYIKCTNYTTEGYVD